MSNAPLPRGFKRKEVPAPSQHANASPVAPKSIVARVASPPPAPPPALSWDLHAFLEYTLCCFSRGPRKERMIRPARGAGSKPTTPRARELWRDGDERPAFGL